MKTIEEIDHIIKFENLIVKIIGKISAISTSKIKKIIVIKKNRNEKGKREDDFGSNPHSNGEDFSRSANLFLERIDAKDITIIVIRKRIKDNIVIENIIYTIIYRPYDWKSYILLYYINN